MRFLCKGCGKGFDVVATLETRTVVVPSPYGYPYLYPFSSDPGVTAPVISSYSCHQSETVEKKPCCPFCGGLEFGFLEVAIPEKGVCDVCGGDVVEDVWRIEVSKGGLFISEFSVCEGVLEDVLRVLDVIKDDVEEVEKDG